MKDKARKPGRIKSAVLNWLGFGLTDYEQWSVIMGKQSETGVTVTPESSMKISAVFACVRLISQTIASLPVGVYRYGDSRVEDRRHPLSSIISLNPNADQTATMFWEAMVASALLVGNGWARKRYLGDRLVALEFLSPYRLRWRLQGSRYVYTYTSIDGSVEEINRDDLFHLPGFTVDGMFGVSAIEYGAEVIGSAQAGNSAANRTFRNGLLPTVAFKIDKFLTPQQREDFRSNLSSISGALNAGKSPLMEGGMSAEEIGIKPSDAQLLESRAYSAEEVCRWFGVPPTMVGLADKASSWASSSEALNRWFLQYTLLPWLVKSQQACNTQLLSPTDRLRYYVEFATEGLLRADSAGRASLYNSSLQNGWMTRNEVRKLENLPAMEGGDIATVQSNLIPLADLGRVSESTGVRNALIQWLKEADHANQG